MYAERRISLPWGALAQADQELVEWVNLLDAGMTRVCTGG